MMRRAIRAMLQHPLTRGLDLDDPRTTRFRVEVIRQKPFLKRIYVEWYCLIRDSLPPGDGRVVELGSGAGFLGEVIPGVLTSEIFLIEGTGLVMDGKELPFAPGSVRAIVMTDVLHHIPDLRRFLKSAARCVRPGGRIVAIEPWVSDWSRVVYGRLHHEPFDPDSREWAFPRQGPLSGANGALPWIVFERDRLIFEHEFPEWRIEAIRPFMPIRYLVAGGVSMRGFAPGWAFGAFRSLERLTGRFVKRTAMFAHLVLVRTGVPVPDVNPAPASIESRGEGQPR